MARLEATAREQARERHAGRHASDCVKQTAIEEGETLRELLTTKASARETLAGASTEPMTELTPQRINQLVQHVECPESAPGAPFRQYIDFDGPSNCCNNIFNFSAHP